VVASDKKCLQVCGSEGQKAFTVEYGSNLNNALQEAAKAPGRFCRGNGKTSISYP